MDEDARLVLAYEAAVARVQQQDTTLGNLRSRAGNLLFSAALLTSFAAGLGLISADAEAGNTLPDWTTISLLGLLVLIGAAVLAIQWPVSEWGFGASAQKIMERVNDGDDLDGIRRLVVTELIAARKANEKRIHRCSLLYRVAVGLLIGEVVALSLGLQFAS